MQFPEHAINVRKIASELEVAYLVMAAEDYLPLLDALVTEAAPALVGVGDYFDFHPNHLRTFTNLIV